MSLWNWLSDVYEVVDVAELEEEVVVLVDVLWVVVLWVVVVFACVKPRKGMRSRRGRLVYIVGGLGAVDVVRRVVTRDSNDVENLQKIPTQQTKNLSLSLTRNISSHPSIHPLHHHAAIPRIITSLFA